MRASMSGRRRFPPVPGFLLLLALLPPLALVARPAAVSGQQCYDYRSHLPFFGATATPGQALDVVVAGDYAYLADGEAGLVIVDVADPTAPVPVGKAATPGIARAVAVASRLAVLAEGATGIAVADITDPLAPSILGGVDTPGNALAVALDAGARHAYVAADELGLQVIDLADPASPTIAGTVDTPGRALDVAVSGSYVFVADHYMGVEVVDVSDPLLPAIVANLPTSSERVVGVDIQGDFAYLAEGEQPSGLAIFDIADPTAPRFVAYRNTPGVGGIDVDGRYAYLQAGPLVYVIDVLDPGQPRVAGAVFGPPASGLAAVGKRLHVAAGAAGLRIVDTRSPDSPLLGFRQLAQFGSVGAVTTFKSLAFVWVSSPIGNGAFYVIAAGPGLPALGVLYFDIPFFDLLATGDHVYALNSSLQIIDVTNPEEPSVLGNAPLPAFGRGVAASGRFAFVAAEGAGLTAVDVSDPGSPIVIANLPLPGPAWDVDVAGPTAVVACRAQGLFTVDVTDPSAMSLLGQMDTPGDALGVRVAGTRAYVADGGAGLAVVDLANPRQPLWLGEADTPGGASDVTVSGDLAYVADMGSGFRVIDIADPSAPRDLGGTYPGFGQTINHGTYVPGNAVQVAVTDETVCVAAGQGGFRLYPLQCAIPAPGRVPDDPTAGAASAARLLVTPNPARGPLFLELVPAPAAGPGPASPGDPAVRIYDVAGRWLERLVLDHPTGVGTRGARWDGRDAHGRPLARGTYYLRVEGPGLDATARLTWLP